MEDDTKFTIKVIVIGVLIGIGLQMLKNWANS